MDKKAFSLVEIIIVVALLVTTIILCLPAIFNNTEKAGIVSRWKSTFSEVKSNFEIFTMNDMEKVQLLCKKNRPNMDEEIYKIIQPYLNSHTPINGDKFADYSYKYYNGASVAKNSLYYTNKFGFDEKGTIVGFRWLDCHCDNVKPCAVAIFDLNGRTKPNRLGRDIFGIYIFKNRIEAFGYNLPNKELEQVCNFKKDNGASCSEYYLRGGSF